MVSRMVSRSAPTHVFVLLLLAAVRWQAGAYPTSLEADEAELAELTGAEGAVDPRALAVLEYRLARKRLLRLTEEILSAFLGQ